MKPTLPLLIFCGMLTAQQASKKPADGIEFCGNGSSHECRCIRYTQAVQDAYLEMCRLNSQTDKEMRQCQAEMPGHCSIVDQPVTPVDDEQGEVQTLPISDRCTMMCKKHDCRCDDGPLCHVGHSASDHPSRARKK